MALHKSPEQDQIVNFLHLATHSDPGVVGFWQTEILFFIILKMSPRVSKRICIQSQGPMRKLVG